MLEVAGAVGAKDRFVDLVPNQLLEHEKQSVVRLALAVLEEKTSRGEAINCPSQVQEYFQIKLAERKSEVFSALFLTTRNTILSYEELFQGTIDGASVHPRVVAQRTLELNASAVIFAHNHPSGHPEPSNADRTITRRLKEALALLDVRVLDHIVVGTAGSVSMAEQGWV